MMSSGMVGTEIAAKATNLYISPGMVSEAIVHQFCVSGDIEKSVRTVSAALGERARVLAESIRKHLPGATFTEPDGGYFLWVDLPSDVDVDKLMLSSDCGLKYLPRASAAGKMRSLTRAAAVLRAELG